MSGFVSRPPRQRIPREKLSRTRLDFTDIADEYIEDVIERYDEVLPPLPPRQVTPPRSPPQLPIWKTPEQIEKMVPKPKTPPPKPYYVMPEVTPHEFFERTSPAVDLNTAMLVETPPHLPRSPPPISPGRMPRRIISPLPEVFGQTPPIYRSPDLASISPCGAGVVEEIFAGAGVSPAKLPPPSPPSPLSTEEAMQQMVAQVRKTAGFGPFQGLWLRRKKGDYKPMRPIKEVMTEPGVGKMGLPEVVQVDIESLGTGQIVEEPYVRTPYLPPPRKQSPVGDIYSPEEEDEWINERIDEIYADRTPPVPPEELQRVVPTSPLPQFEQAGVTPPRLSPKLPQTPAGVPLIEQTAMSFENIEAYDRLPSTPLRIPQVTPKPSPFLTPSASPRWTPSYQRILSPQLPSQDVEGSYISDYSGHGSWPGSPEYYEESYEQQEPSPTIPPQYIPPDWVQESATPEASFVEEDEMGLPGLVQLYAQHMAPIYASPTERRERRIITWEDQPQVAPVRSPMIRTGGEIQVDTLPVPEEQVQMDIPIAPLEPYVAKTSVPPPNLSPTLPQYEGVALDEQFDMEALYAEQYGEYEVYEAASVPSAGTPSPQRQPSPRTPSPRRQPSPRTPPQTIQKWDQLLDETRHADRFETSMEYAASPEQISPCTPCGSPTRSPMTMRSPQFAAQQIARSPQAVRPQSPRAPQALARSPRAIRPQTPPIARPPMSPIEVPELSPLRFPQPSPPYAPAAVSTSPGKVVKQKMTERRFVTVIPPPPSIPLEFEGEIVEQFGGADKSDSDIQDEDRDYRWMD